LVQPVCSKFQSVIEKVLIGAKGVNKCLDNIIVTGSSEQEHLDKKNIYVTTDE